MTMMPGAQPIAETHTYYVQYDNGALGRIETSEETPVLTRPGQLISEEEYQTLLAAVKAARQEHLDDLMNAEASQKQEDYQALRLLLVPEATARRLSGWTGED
jgi:hypothetical protein